MGQGHAAQILRHLQQCRVLLDLTLGAVDGRHRACRHPAAQAERDKAVEDRLVVLAELPLVLVRTDAEIEGAVVLPGIVVDDVAHQDQSGAVFGVVRHRIGVEHHREPVAVGDAGKDRDHFLVAFERMDIDDAAAAFERRQAGGADERFDSRLGEHVGQFLFGHPQRLDVEEPVEQAIDVGILACDMIAIAGKRLQLALLAFQPSPGRTADQARGRRLRRDRQQRAVVGRGLVRQQRHRVRQLAPPHRLPVQRQHVGSGLI